MRLTLHTDYALRMLIYLGLSAPGHATIAEISRAYGISENHLVKVAHRLGQLGFVKTSHGRGGGLRLARPAAEIIVGQVVRQTEEDLALVACFANGACAITPACRLRGVLGEALAAFLGVLDRYSVADLLCGGQGAATAKLLGLFPSPVSVETPSRTA
jgi:Rrf2 family transcriptional regulator, nitric oxide-sensitive transcriptional repressor